MFQNATIYQFWLTVYGVTEMTKAKDIAAMVLAKLYSRKLDEGKQFEDEAKVAWVVMTADVVWAALKTASAVVETGGGEMEA